MTPTKITIHCSATPNGRHVSTDTIRRWHINERGWADIGYHKVVEADGGVGNGRSETVRGAHVKNHNEGNLGVCMVGLDKFTHEQFASLRSVLRNWMVVWGIPLEAVYCHRDFDTAIAEKKTCPNMDISDLRAWLDGDESAISKYILEAA